MGSPTFEDHDMNMLAPFLAGFVLLLAAAYLRLRLTLWPGLTAVAIVATGWLCQSGVLATGVPLLLLAAVALPLNRVAFRRERLSAPLLALFAQVPPKLSDTGS